MKNKMTTIHEKIQKLSKKYLGSKNNIQVTRPEIHRACTQILELRSRGLSEGAILASITDEGKIDVYYSALSQPKIYENEKWTKSYDRVIYIENANSISDLQTVELDVFNALLFRGYNIPDVDEQSKN